MTDRMIQVTSENAPKFLDWLANRQGIAVWQNVAFDSAGFGREVFQPVLDPDGNPYRFAQVRDDTPWKYGQQPQRVVTDMDEIEVIDYAVATTLTDVAQRNDGEPYAKDMRRIEKAMAAASAKAWWRWAQEKCFYGKVEIMVPGPVVSLSEWEAQREWEENNAA